MDLRAKLQIKPGQRVAIVAATDDVPSVAVEGAKTADAPDAADVVVAFIRTRADLEAVTRRRPDRPGPWRWDPGQRTGSCPARRGATHPLPV